MVTVASDVDLEILDWGRSGRPLVLPHASHYVFPSHPDEVIAAIAAYLATLEGP